MKKNKIEYIDDGRTIADMNVEGMPWYNPVRDSKLREKPVSGEQLGFKETLAVMRGVLRAGLLVAAVFAVGFLAFILFCVFVWFK